MTAENSDNIIDVPTETQEEEIATPSRLGGWLAALSGTDTPSVASAVIGSMTSPLGGLLKYSVLILVWILLASSSFTFGTDFVGAWLFRSYIGDTWSLFISGLACFVLFDLAYTSSLTSFFTGARSNFQRALYLVFFIVPFILGLVASLTGFMLITDSVTLTAGEREFVSSLGRLAIYAGIVNLALYGILPNAVDPDNIRTMLGSMIESNRESRKQTAWLMMELESEREYFRTVRNAAVDIGRAHGQSDVEEFKRYHLGQLPLALPQNDNVWEVPPIVEVIDEEDEAEADPKA